MTMQNEKIAERLSDTVLPLNPNLPGGSGTPRALHQPDDMRRLTEMLATRATENGKFAREHGQYVDELSIAFAKQLVDLGRTYTRDVLAAEGRRTEQLKKQLGNERGPTSQG